jgi:hypothetical protein
MERSRQRTQIERVILVKNREINNEDACEEIDRTFCVNQIEDGGYLYLSIHNIILIREEAEDWETLCFEK